MVAFIATETVLSIMIGGKHRFVTFRSPEHRKELLEMAYKTQRKESEKNLEELEALLSPIKRMALESDNRLEINYETNELFLKGSEVPISTGLSDRILSFIDDRLPIEPLLKFWSSCLENKFFDKAIPELFQFLEENHFPITEDGGFIGYKMLNFHGNSVKTNNFNELYLDKNGRVRKSKGYFVSPEIAQQYKEFLKGGNTGMMKDVYSGSIKQKIGDVVEINSHVVDTDSRMECSTGLHVGAFDYQFSGDVRVLVKVFPKDVINANTGQQKMRVIKYEILSFVDEETKLQEKLLQYEA